MKNSIENILQEQYPGRSKQITTLLKLIGQPTDPSPPSIFIYGHMSSGKTSLTKSIFSLTLPAHHYTFINCIECYNPRLIFEHALNQWTSTVPSYANGYKGYARCNSVNDFIVKCGDIAGDGRETKYLILDKAERLRDMTPTLLPSLLRLSELTRKPFTVILLTTLAIEKFRTSTGLLEPLILYFPEYDKQDVLAILAKDCPSRITGEKKETRNTNLPFFLDFVEIIYDIFQKNCKDLNELRHLVALLFPKYVEPILEGRVQRNEPARLFKYAQPYFIEAMDKLYLREISSSEWAQRKDSSEGDSAGTRFPKNDVDLPYYTKYLLMASFLASYNPPRLDVRYFGKFGAEEKKRRKRGSRLRVDKLGGKMRQQLLGPKAFPVERMLAIFYSILDEPIGNTVDIQLQITSLVTLRLLTRTTSLDRLDSVKCKCNVSYEFVKEVARSVGFSIEQYLYDFI